MDDNTLLLWIDRGKNLAALLVVIGVAGELLGDFLAGPARKRQEESRKLEIAGLTKKAGEADQKAEGFRLQIAQANERAANAEKETARLKRTAEDERIARVRIEERMAPRRITSKQHDEFVSVLIPYSGSVVGLEQLGEKEATTFAEDILNVLSDSGWNVLKSFSGIVSPPPYGLICIVDDSTPAGKALGALLKTLPTANVRFSPVKGGVASILVGLKPPP